jgi:adhesin transport system membrane fusion protein
MSVGRFKELSRQLDERADIKSSYSLYVIIFFIVVFALWATSSEIDNVTRGKGKVMSSLQNQIVQASTSGVILAKYVREDELVSKGDKLIDIDPVEATGELNQLELKLAALSVKELRLNAELEGEDFIIHPDLKEKVSAASITEESIFFGNSAKLISQEIILTQRLEQKKQDFKASVASEAAILKTIALLKSQISIVKPLVEENLAPRINLIDLQKELERETGKFESARINKQRATYAIAEIQQELTNLSEKFYLEAVEELNALVSKKLELQQLLPKLLERVSRKTIRAPMSGIVKKVNYNTLGGFVNRGDVILELVPTDDQLMVEGSIQSSDISTIKVGDPVRIRLSAYNSIKYGTMEGHVTSISPDSTNDPDTGAAIYPIDVEIDEVLKIDGKNIILIPGMVADIDVLTGKRTIFEYFWQPVARIQELALRD